MSYIAPTTILSFMSHKFHSLKHNSRDRAGSRPVFCCVNIMANEQNLKKGKGFDSRTTEEQRKIAQKGGIASGKARREQKLIRDRILERMGESDWDTMIDNLIERASSDTKSFEVLRDTIGQRPTEKIAVGASDEAKNELAELLEQRKNNACK